MQLKNNIHFIFISAFLTGIAQLIPTVGFITWFSIIPFIYVLVNTNTIEKTLVYSFLWGIIYNLVTVFWISQNIGTNTTVAFISMFATVLILSCNTIIVSLLWYRIKSINGDISLILFPFVWTSVEFIKSYGVLGFPWISIANTQTNYFYLIQNAEYFGIYGITFWVLLINVLFYKLYSFQSRRNVIMLMFSVLFPFITGYFLYNSLDESLIEDYTVSLVQPNIMLDDKRDFKNADKHFNKLIDVSKESIENGADLVVWPESALPFQNVQNEYILNKIVQSLLIDNDVHILTGNVMYEANNVYNSSVLINKEGIKNYYHKRQLVPMGEYVPLSDKVEFLSNINFGQANFSSGDKDVVFNVNNTRFSSLICFESTFPGINRRHAKKGADYFVYLVNDGWYTKVFEPRQHTNQSIYRAIENRNSVLRCANTGFSAVIDPSGTIRELTKLNTNDVITTFIKKSNRITFYTLYGNVFVYLLLIIIGVFSIKPIFKDEKNN